MSLLSSAAICPTRRTRSRDAPPFEAQQPALSIDNMLISVVIPTLNEAANIGRCIASIKSHWPSSLHLEILVGDHGSTDSTIEIAKAGGARTISLPGGTVGELRNRVVAECRGSILIFLDADCTVTVEWGENLPMTLHDIGTHPRQVTGSLCYAPDSDNLLNRYWFSRIDRDSSGYIGTGHMIVPAELFRELKGFALGLRSGEDYDFCMRAKAAGASIVLRPDLRVVHHGYPLTVASFLRREAWHGLGDFQSLEAFKASRVALASASLLATQSAAFLAAPFRIDIAIVLQSCVIALVFGFSVLKFPNLGLWPRLVNAGIFYLYLIARGLSPFAARLRCAHQRRSAS